VTDKAPGWWQTYHCRFSNDQDTAEETFAAPEHHCAAEWFVQDSWDGTCGDFAVDVRTESGTVYIVTITVEPSFTSRY
jgi:hypothetical protein